VANKGLYECQAIPLRNGTVEIALTLLRCVGWLSQKNLPRRPRDAGPYIETPEGQQLGEHVFEYSIIPHEGNWNIAKALAYGFNLPMRSMATSCHEGTLPLNCSMVETSTDDFMISAVKRSEDGKSLLIRGYNPGGKDIIGKLKTWKTPLSVSTSTLDEKEEHTVPLDDDGSFQFIAKSYEVLSFSLKF